MPSLPFTSIIRNYDGTWKFQWSDTGNGPYRIILYGIEVDEVDEVEYDWVGNGFKAYPPPIEVIEDGEVAVSEVNNPSFLIEWNRVEDAAGYSIERYIGSAWTRVESLDETGQATYSYQTPPLANDTVCQLRVLAEDEFGNQSAPVYFTKTIIAAPPITDGTIQVTYAPNAITIAAV